MSNILIVMSYVLVSETIFMIMLYGLLNMMFHVVPEKASDKKKIIKY